MNKREIFFTCLNLAFVATLSGCGGKTNTPAGAPPPGPASVSVVPAIEKSFTDREEFSGQLEAAEFVELRSRVAGIVDQVHFTDGALVSRGQTLFTIDPRPDQELRVKIMVKGQETSVPFKDLYSFVFFTATGDQQAELMPVRENLVNKIESEIQKLDLGLLGAKKKPPEGY